MDTFIILNVQSTLTLIIFAMIAKWYIAPRLSHLKLKDALIPLLLVHAFRYTPLTLLVNGQVSADIPDHVANTIAYGDFIAGILALIAILMLKFNIKGAITMTWVFNIFGMLDIINALRVGVGAELFNYSLGFNWYILNYYVPVLIVTHIIMISWLIRKKD